MPPRARFPLAQVAVTIGDWPTGDGLVCRDPGRPYRPAGGPRRRRKEPVPVRNPSPKDAAELDAVETREWLDSLDYVLQSGGPAKVQRLLRELTLHATESGVKIPFTANTPYTNTIPADEQVLMPGSPDLERRIKSLVRWNAAAMVVRANKA